MSIVMTPEQDFAQDQAIGSDGEKTDLDFAAELKASTMAVRLMQSRFGTRKNLKKAQVATAAEVFRAEESFVTAAKKILDTTAECYSDVVAVLYNAKGYWKSVTSPFPENGVRLINVNRVDAFNDQMREFKVELEKAVDVLAGEYAGLREAARAQLGDLFDPADYPDDICDEFDLDWEFVSVDPPEYLKDLNPELYEAQKQRALAKFEAALGMAEGAAIEELHKLVSNLADRLSPGEDGKPKVIRTSAVDNIKEFIKRFREMQIGSNAALQALIEDAEERLAGVSSERLKKDGGLRATIGEEMAKLRDSVGAMIVTKPRRMLRLDGEDGEQVSEPASE